MCVNREPVPACLPLENTEDGCSVWERTQSQKQPVFGMSRMQAFPRRTGSSASPGVRCPHVAIQSQ